MTIAYQYGSSSTNAISLSTSTQQQAYNKILYSIKYMERQIEI